MRPRAKRPHATCDVYNSKERRGAGGWDEPLSLSRVSSGAGRRSLKKSEVAHSRAHRHTREREICCMCETERRTARRKPKPRNRRSPLQYGVRDCVRAPISNIDRGVTVGVAHRGQTCTHSYSGSASPHTGHRALSRARPHHAQTHDHERRAVPALCVVPLPLFPAHVRRHACGTLSIGGVPELCTAQE